RTARAQRGRAVVVTADHHTYRHVLRPQLVENPLPVDAKLSAAARGLQIAGIYICIVGNRDLADCACLRDVLKVEGKERLQRLIQGAMEDWKGLPRRIRDGVTEL
ncbi:hypothetical protein, partial [Streptomyces sp. NPDC052015]|uniref:hypothetical protein n=1 Tax=Streptomyces sp. NPDC052015 TaxID=3154755 RepID=UPI0034288DD8